MISGFPSTCVHGDVWIDYEPLIFETPVNIGASCFSFLLVRGYLVFYVDRGAETGWWGNLYIGAVSPHRLDSLNTSNHLLYEDCGGRG